MRHNRPALALIDNARFELDSRLTLWKDIEGVA
jgi:hypothetical protein